LKSKCQAGADGDGMGGREQRKRKVEVGSLRSEINLNLEELETSLNTASLSPRSSLVLISSNMSTGCLLRIALWQQHPILVL